MAVFDDFKNEVLRAVVVEREVSDLLGKHDWSSGNERRYSCPLKGNHNADDNNPSLVVNISTGLFLCHGCHWKGDLFDLYAEVHNLDRVRDFGTILRRLGAKYGVGLAKPKTDGRKNPKKPKGVKVLPSDHRDVMRYKLAFKKGMPTKVRDYLLANYGITPETCQQFGLAYNYHRLWIPIPKEWWDKKNPYKSSLVGIRKHDVMRKHCVWVDDEDIYPSPKEGAVPSWKAKKTGKVIGVSGYNSVYIYPAETLFTNGEVWLVGGELKAVLLNQIGIPAVTWTSGEGRYAKLLLRHFADKVVRVVMDTDSTGKEATEKLASVLVDNGAREVWKGEIPAEGLPDGGNDITDFLREASWDPKVLRHISWKKQERRSRRINIENELKDEEPEEVPSFDDKLPSVRFDQLLNPRNMGKWIKTKYIVAGRQDTPFVAPFRATAFCEAAAMTGKPREVCDHCPLQRTDDYSRTITFEDSVRLEFAGLSPLKTRAKAIAMMRLPKCQYPQVELTPDTLTPAVAINPLDVDDSSGGNTFVQLPFWQTGLDKDDPNQLGEFESNQTYESIGKVVASPRDSQLTYVASRQRMEQGNVFAYKHDAGLSNRLESFFEEHTAYDGMRRLVSYINDRYIGFYQSQDLILYELLTFFMPFHFRIGGQPNTKVCAETAIIGESRCGKSTCAKRLIELYAAGRYVDVSKATDIGLIGGETSIGNKKIFTWGVFPMSHGAIVVIDEANKLHVEQFGSLTNLRSSGIAERVTVSGHRKALSNVRILWLANPRGNRKLQKYADPMRAGYDLFGTEQDMARLDMFMTKRRETDAHGIHSVSLGVLEDLYTKDLARYHLAWAWSLREKDFIFEDPFYLLDKTTEIIPGIEHPMLYPTEARYKLGRMAATIAALTYSRKGEYQCRVSNDCVDAAATLIVEMLEATSPGFSSASSIEIPSALVGIFNEMREEDLPKLRVFCENNMISQSDLKGLFPHSVAFQLISILPFQLKLAEYNNGKLFWDNRLQAIVAAYLEREG